MKLYSLLSNIFGVTMPLSFANIIPPLISNSPTIYKKAVEFYDFAQGWNNASIKDPLNSTSPLKLLEECYRKFTDEKYISLYTGKSKLVRKINLYKEFINRDVNAIDYKKIVANIQKKSIENAKDVRLYSKQFDELFNFINKNETLKTYCEDMIYLSAEKLKIETRLIDGNTYNIESITKNSQKEDLINLRIKATEKIFIYKLKEVLKRYFNDHSEIYEICLGILKNGSENNNLKLQEFLHFYTFKQKIIHDNKFKVEIYQDISKYIFTSSIGVLGANQYIEAKYGKFIAESLNSSFIGDIDSSNNISNYFMQTLYNLLNHDGFSLKELCIGDLSERSNRSKSASARAVRFGKESFVVACEDSYKLKSDRKDILNEICDYYNDLIDEKIIDTEINGNSIFIWNLLGGIKASDGKKEGLFYRIDKQLEQFTPAKSADIIYKSAIGFGSVKSRKEFLEKLNKKLNNIEEPSNSLFKDINIKKIFSLYNYLAEIARRLYIHKFNIEEHKIKQDENQINLLKSDIDKVFKNFSKQSKELSSPYLEELLNKDNVDDFLKFKKLFNKDILNSTEISGNDSLNLSNSNLIKHINDYEMDVNIDFIQTKRDFYNKRIYNIQIHKLINTKHNEVNKFLNQYHESISDLKNKINKSEVFGSISSIFNNYEQLINLIKFYNHLKNKTRKTNSNMLKVANYKTIESLLNNASTTSKKEIKDIIKHYNTLKYKIDKNITHTTEEEIIHYTVYKVLFNIADNNPNTKVLSFLSLCNNPQMSDNDFLIIKKLWLVLDDINKNLFTDEFKSFLKESNVKSFPKNILKLQNNETLLNTITNEFIDGLKNIKLVHCSLNNIQSFNKFRLISDLKMQINIISGLIKIITDDDVILELDKNIFSPLHTILSEIEETKKDHNNLEVYNIFNQISNIFDKIIISNNDSLNTTIKYNNVEYKINPEANKLYKFKKTYSEYCEFKPLNKLDKMPFIYKTLLNKDTKDNKLQKLLRLITSNIFGVSQKNKDDNPGVEYFKINNDVAELENIRLNNLTNMFSLHTQFVNCFSNFSDTVQKNSNEIMLHYSLIQKTLFYKINNSSNKKIRNTDLKFLTSEEKKLFYDLEFLTSEEKKLFDNSGLVNLDNKDIIERLINKFNTTYNLNQNNYELHDFIKKSINMNEEVDKIITAISLLEDKCKSLQITLGKPLNQINSTINELAKNYPTKEHKKQLYKLALYFCTSFEKNANNNLTTYILDNGIINKKVELFNLLYQTIEKAQDNNHSLLYSYKDLITVTSNELKNSDLCKHKFELFEEVSDNMKNESKNAFQMTIKENINANQNSSITTLYEMIVKKTENLQDYNLIKYTLNQWSYSKLAKKFSNMYIQYHFKLEELEKLIDLSIEEIIRIKNNEKKYQPIILNSDNKLILEFNNTYAKYEKYTKSSINKLDLLENNNALQNLLDNNLLDIDLNTLTHGQVKYHEWLIKTIEIIQTLDKIKLHNIPEIRFNLHIEAIFSYLEILDSSMLNPLNKLKLELFHSFKNVSKCKDFFKINNLFNSFFNDSSENPIFNEMISLLEKILNEEINNVEVIRAITEKIWPTILNLIEKQITNATQESYYEDLKEKINPYKSEIEKIKNNMPNLFKILDKKSTPEKNLLKTLKEKLHNNESLSQNLDINDDSIWEDNVTNSPSPSKLNNKRLTIATIDKQNSILNRLQNFLSQPDQLLEKPYFRTSFVDRENKFNTTSKKPKNTSTNFNTNVKRNINFNNKEYLLSPAKNMDNKNSSSKKSDSDKLSLHEKTE